jgi:hypothetical protein
MAKLTASRSAQWPLVAEFSFNFDDTMVNTSGVEVDFGSSNVAATVVELIPLPPGAVVTGGSVDRSVAFDAATYNVSIGDSAVADRYLSVTDLKAVGSTALVPTGYRGVGQNVRMTVTAADVCTTGVATVRVEYVVEGRSNEVQIS